MPENWLEHNVGVLGAIAIGFAIVGSTIVYWYLKKVFLKLDTMDHPRDGYVSLASCERLRSGCQMESGNCMDRIIRTLSRVERKIERNGAVTFIMADLLVEKKIFTGEDLMKLRDRFEQYREKDET